MVENINDYTKELIDKLRSMREDLNDDIHAINYALEKVVNEETYLSNLNDKVLNRLEQLETRQLEQDFFTKKMLGKILNNLEHK